MTTSASGILAPLPQRVLAPQESAPKAGVRKAPGIRCGQALAGASLAVATVWWLSSLARLEGSAAGVFTTLGGAGVVFVLCLAVHGLVALLAPKDSLNDPLAFSHYLQGMLVFATYALAYAIEPRWFMQTWRSIYFGYYAYDIVVLVLRWGQLSKSFRTFYTVHHSVSFLITGLWMTVGGAWLGYMVLGVMLWLSSDVWVYGLAMLRSAYGRRMGPGLVLRLQVGVFCVERGHRLLAYLVPCVIAGFHLSTLALVVLGTGLANDALDAVFQWRGIRRKLRRGRRPMPRARRRLHAARESAA